jgi:hypothetical protein
VNCDLAHDRLSALLDAELSADERGAVEAHLRACESCHRRYLRLLATQELMRSAVPQWSPRPNRRVRPMIVGIGAAASLLAALWLPSAVRRPDRPMLTQSVATAVPANAVEPSDADVDVVVGPPLLGELIDCNASEPALGCIVEIDLGPCAIADECGLPAAAIEAP